MARGMSRKTHSDGDPTFYQAAARIKQEQRAREEAQAQVNNLWKDIHHLCRNRGYSILAMSLMVKELRKRGWKFRKEAGDDS